MNWLQLAARAYHGMASRARNHWYRAMGVHITGYVWLRRISIPRQWGDIRLEGGASLDDGVVLLCSGPPRSNKLSIKTGTYVNRNTIFDVHERIEVGENCLIGPGCYLTDAAHGIAAGALVREQRVTTRPVLIEDDVWLGAGVIVLSGVRIGRGAIVGAGAVVTRDVANHTVVAGVPARPLTTRGETHAAAASPLQGQPAR